MICTDVETIKAARKPHLCSWCGQRIKIADSYKRWRCYDGGDASTVRMHLECNDAAAADPFVKDDGGEFELFSNERPALRTLDPGCLHPTRGKKMTYRPEGEARCPNCGYAEFPGQKRGMRCTTCDGSGWIEQAEAAPVQPSATAGEALLTLIDRRVRSGVT